MAGSLVWRPTDDAAEVWAAFAKAQVGSYWQSMFRVFPAEVYEVSQLGWVPI